MPLSQDEALLRVALLMARCDGHAAEEETAAALQAMPRLVQGLSQQDLALLAVAADKDLRDNPEDDVMRRVLVALPDHGARVAALRVACAVAIADGMLSWAENSSLSRLATQLQLSRRDVSTVVRSTK